MKEITSYLPFVFKPHSPCFFKMAKSNFEISDRAWTILWLFRFLASVNAFLQTLH